MNIFTIIIPVFLLVISFLRGRPIFEYDSDGETITIKNSHLYIFFPKKIQDEFPKYKLLDYDIVNLLIYKRLYVKINSKKNDLIVLKYDISFLTSKELKDVKFSLNKTIKNNKEKQDNL